ncbi:MAG: NADPH-dependent F420 reductase [Actinomycetota bacterium]|nr:NADPH-dependent F420 reductase [Actinomycetota bacterium]
MTTDSTAAHSDAPQQLDVSKLTIGVLGGTGEQGRGLARRLAMSGQEVIIGSRDASRAQGIADEIGFGVVGQSNEDCATESDVVIVAVPWDGHAQLLQGLVAQLVGKVVVDCVNPLGFDKQGAFALPVPEGSAAQQAAAILTRSRVVGAFHHISAVLLLDPDVTSIDTDVLVVGDDREATDLVQALASQIDGMRGIYAGRLRNCGQIETFTANLISINRRYKAHSGIRVTDVN